MSHIKPFYAENPFWMRMGIFLIVILIHPIYLWIKRISEGLILQKIWQWEKFFQEVLDAHLFLLILTTQVPFPIQRGPFAPVTKSSSCLFALRVFGCNNRSALSCGFSPGPGDGVGLLQNPLFTDKIRLWRNTRSRAIGTQELAG